MLGPLNVPVEENATEPASTVGIVQSTVKGAVVIAPVVIVFDPHGDMVCPVLSKPTDDAVGEFQVKAP